MVKRTGFEELILSKALQFKLSTRNSDLVDMLERSGDIPDGMLKNVCAKVTVELSDKLDEVCNLLSISKRRFIESALVEALQQAEKIMHDDVDMLERIENLPPMPDDEMPALRSGEEVVK